MKGYLEFNSSVLITSAKSPSINVFTCYDDYYCNNHEFANVGHIALGIFGLLLTLVGLILNILLIPVMSLVGIRSSSTYYMIAMAISDACLLIIDLILVVIRYLPSSDQTDQLLMYQNFVAYFVPFGLPAKSLCQILTLTLCTGLVIDRSMYLRNERKPKNYMKCTIAVKAIISIVAFMIVTKLPNFLLLKIVESDDLFPAFISVRWTLLAKSWIFIFDAFIFISTYSVLICAVVLLFYLSTCNHSIPRFNLKNRFEVPPEQRIRRRERLYLAIGLFIGIFTVFLKFPHLLRYFFFGFDPVTRDDNQRYNLAVVDVWMEMTDLVLVVLKPVLYLISAVHVRQALKDMIGLWCRPSRYSELKVSGGMGKVVDLRNNGEKSKINRSDTADTLLRCCNSDNRLNESKINSHSSKNVIMIQALAKEHVLKPNNQINSISSGSYLGSTTSFTSCYNSESQSSNAKT